MKNDDEMKSCACCGKELGKDEGCEFNGKILCGDCHDEEEDLRAIEEEWIE